MSLDQFPILRPNRHPTKAFVAKVDRASSALQLWMNSLIAKAQRCQVQVRGQRILKIAGNVLRGSAAKDFFMNRHPIFLRGDFV
jgi:hypothetical protein